MANKPNPNAPELIDSYIDQASPFAQPILIKLRSLVLLANKEIHEDWKWNAPNFGHGGMICWLAGFKKHVGMNFFKGAFIEDKHNLFDATGIDNKTNRIIKFTSLDDIDEEKLLYYIDEAIKVNASGVKHTGRKKILEIPQCLWDELDKFPAAKSHFEGFTDAQRNEYVEWITGAKKVATRDNRMTQMMKWVSEGKTRNWKYQNC